MSRQIEIIVGTAAILTWIALLFFHYGADFWWSKWAFYAFLGSVLSGVVIARSVTVLVGVFFAYQVLTGVRLTFWRVTELATIPPHSATAMESVVGQALVLLLLSGFAALLYRPTWDKWIRLGLAVGTILGALHVIFAYASGLRDFKISGFLEQGGMSGCLLAVGAPFLGVFRKKWMIVSAWTVTSIAILILLKENESSNSIGVFVVTVATLLLYKYWGRVSRAWLLGLTSVSVAGLGLVSLKLNPLLFSDSTRFEIYRVMMGWWWKDGSILFGKGYGSFILYGPWIQVHQKFSLQAYFIWMHSDWIQILFESGIVGLALSVAVTCQILYRARHRVELLVSIVAFIATMVFQFPWHLANFAAAGTLLGLMALKGEVDA